MKLREFYDEQYVPGRGAYVAPAIGRPRGFVRRHLRRWDYDPKDVSAILVAKQSKGGKILDVGCGSGYFLFRCRQSFERLYGVDIAARPIEEARKRFEPLVRAGMKPPVFLVGDIGDGTDFEDGFFDFVTCIHVLEHVFDPFAVMEEFRRILKDAGRLLVSVPNVAYIKRRIKLLFGIIPWTHGRPGTWKRIGWDGGHLHYFTRKTLVGLFRQFGFRILKVSGSGAFASLRNWWPSLLTGDITVLCEKRAAGSARRGGAYRIP